jgi:hypothetical protein
MISDLEREAIHLLVRHKVEQAGAVIAERYAEANADTRQAVSETFTQALICAAATSPAAAGSGCVNETALSMFALTLVINAVDHELSHEATARGAALLLLTSAFLQQCEAEAGRVSDALPALLKHLAQLTAEASGCDCETC